MDSTSKTSLVDAEDDRRKSSYSSKSRVSVDAAHPRFLLENERGPVSSSASTEDYFCEQCKFMFPGTVDGVRRHFQLISHTASASCRYCGGGVFEYVDGDIKRFAHDCCPKKASKRT